MSKYRAIILMTLAIIPIAYGYSLVFPLWISIIASFVTGCSFGVIAAEIDSQR